MRKVEFTESSPGSLVLIAEPDVLAYVPAPLPRSLAISGQAMKNLEAASGALGELRGLGEHLPNPNLLIRPFMQKEAVLSSRIEGTQTSLSELMLYEAEERRHSSPNPDALEVRNYMRALEYALEAIEDLPVCMRLLLEAHTRLLTGVRGHNKSPGQIRKTQVHIGTPGSTARTATYVPPPPNELGGLIRDWESYIHEEHQTPSLVRLALIHYQFEAIHPFLDGNGRIGRLVITLLLCAWGLLPRPMLYLSAFFEQHRSDYYSLLLGVSQRGEWSAWVEFFLEGISVQSRDACLRARSLLSLREEYLGWARSLSYGAVPTEIIEALFQAPVVDIELLTILTKRTAPGIRKYLQPMIDRSILTEVSGRQRDRVYKAPEILRLLELEMEALPSIGTTAERDSFLRDVTNISDFLNQRTEES